MISRFILLFILLFNICNKIESQSNRVLLRDITSLTLRRGDYTTRRRSLSIPQLECVGGTAAGKFFPKVVQCYNRCFNGTDVQWECKTFMSNAYKLGKISVFCEGFDSPNDPYILAGSCGLKYEIDYTFEENQKLINTEKILFFVISSFVFYFIYTIFSNPFKKQRISKRRSAPLVETYKKFKNDLNFCGLQSTSFISEDSFLSSSVNLLSNHKKVVESIWYSTPEQFPLDQVCIEAYGITILRRDLLKLKSGDWINDEIINFFMSLIVERSKNIKILPKTYSFNTYFYRAYSEKGYEGVKKWTKSVDIFNYDIILIPIHLGAHWCLAVIDIALKKIEYYDSMLSDGTSCLLGLRDYLAEEYMEKKGVSLDISVYNLINKKEIPTQKKGYDCGVFICRFAECISRRAPIQFNTDNMDNFRAQMTLKATTGEQLLIIKSNLNSLKLSINTRGNENEESKESFEDEKN